MAEMLCGRTALLMLCETRLAGLFFIYQRLDCSSMRSHRFSSAYPFAPIHASGSRNFLYHERRTNLN